MWRRAAGKMHQRPEMEAHGTIGGGMQVQLEIKRIDLWSLFKIAFIIYAIVGILVGVFFFFFSLLMGSIGSSMAYEEEFSGFPFLGGAVGLLMIPFFAFFYGVIGSVFATIGAWIYNLICTAIGGLRVHANADGWVPSTAVPPPPPSPPPAPQHYPPYTTGSGGGQETGGPV